MNKILSLYFPLFLLGFISCKDVKELPKTEIDTWQLGWRMVLNSMNENHELASLQLDSLMAENEDTSSDFLGTGLESKHALGKTDEVLIIISRLDSFQKTQLCKKDFFTSFEICKDYKGELVENPDLQIELIKMYINDQYVRSNLMEDMLNKYGLKEKEVIIDSFGVATDERNRNQLEKIIQEFGFPTLKMVGKDAMDGVFYIIQHADGNKEWQAMQLSHIKKAVDNGDLEAVDYAYLYDRIKVNSGEPQLYGTQFSKVDPINRIVEFAPIEDEENVDKRRREMAMMPIDMYKKLVLNAF